MHGAEVTIQLKGHMRNLTTTIAFALALTACGASARETAISTTLAATKAADAAFIAYDLTHQRSFEHQGDEAKERAAVAAWRVTQLKIAKGFSTVYRAVATAATLEDQPSVDGLIKAASILYSELRDLGVIK